MKPWMSVLFGVLIGLIAMAAVFLVGTKPRGKPIELIPPPTPAPISVYVVGAVQKPGVVHPSIDARVVDAVELAGGLTDKADSVAINMAMRISDGAKIVVPTVRPTLDPEQMVLQPTDASRGSPISMPLSQENPLDINAATQDDFDLLPGIGPTRAADIIAYREAHGMFAVIEDLKKVPGIGESIYDGFKDLIVVNP